MAIFSKCGEGCDKLRDIEEDVPHLAAAHQLPHRKPVRRGADVLQIHCVPVDPQGLENVWERPCLQTFIGDPDGWRQAVHERLEVLGHLLPALVRVDWMLRPGFSLAVLLVAPTEFTEEDTNLRLLEKVCGNWSLPDQERHIWVPAGGDDAVRDRPSSRPP